MVRYEFSTVISDQHITVYGDKELTDLIKNNEVFQRLPENEKKIYLPTDDSLFEIENLVCSASVKWSADIDIRTWGIKSIQPSIQKVDVSMNVKVIAFDENDTEYTFVVQELTISSTPDEPYSLVAEPDDITRLTIESLDVDLESKMIEADFRS